MPAGDSRSHLPRDVDPATAAIARGIVQHHADDDSFHRSRPFVELSMKCAVAIRDRLPADDGLRPSFLGHILVEMLLDAHLHRTRPGSLDRYYQALQAVNPFVVSAAVGRITGKPTDRIAGLIPKFVEERFLYDYSDDHKLLRRLNQVMKRVGLDPLPDLLMDYFSEVRAEVCRFAPQLLATSAPLL